MKWNNRIMSSNSISSSHGRDVVTGISRKIGKFNLPCIRSSKLPDGDCGRIARLLYERGKIKKSMALYNTKVFFMSVSAYYLRNLGGWLSRTCASFLLQCSFEKLISLRFAMPILAIRCCFSVCPYNSPVKTPSNCRGVLVFCSSCRRRSEAPLP